MSIEHEQIEFDVLFVGGGPASLAGAIRLMQLAQETNTELEVALIEKGAEVGSHAMSGAILDPKALRELIPDYAEQGCPVEATIRDDEFCYLLPDRRYRLPMTPKYMHNKGFPVISLSRFTRWLGGIAEEMGVNIFPGFAGKEVLYGEDGKTIIGVRTGDKGIGGDGQPKANFEPGFDLMAKVTVFGEGARGSLTRTVAGKLGIDRGKMPQVYETGIKEVIQLPEENYFTDSRANAIHCMGYPLGFNTPGGGFIYEMGGNRIAIGYLTALCYENPLTDPYEEFLKFKKHPFVAEIIKGGKVLEQGARTVSNGGWFTMPKLAVDGGMFIGGTAALQNVPALKGIHLSMKSGMLAAEACLKALEVGRFDEETLSAYPQLFKKSWAEAEMYEGRNCAQALAKKGLLKLIYLGAQYFTDGRGVRDFMPTEEDAGTLGPMAGAEPPEAFDSQELDGSLYVDKLTGVYLSKTLHREDQPSHLIVHDPDLCISTCYPTYGSPCTRFCPGKVYEIVEDEKGAKKLKLNPSNCFHCKTCDIKDPYGNITWVCPEGGDGPGYNMV
ncbi:protein EtfO [Desulfonema ishimotonii]|uniref:Electron transfer flavoprotein-ubiquinone oxidoreductase n=1 Tax=Desulfonema ishimotonii TaxID=45657 RepID=A0A401G0G3_9BACT|nr:electron transfer flavoprotein-ubiquinone oxidoreductase [Desulfonema ishimotonii]GBC62710.1 protein EtfO [Desulfonema ishimotonii]